MTGESQSDTKQSFNLTWLSLFSFCFDAIPENLRTWQKKYTLLYIAYDIITNYLRSISLTVTCNIHNFVISGFECSAGIAHNKILAKLVCGMNKPNKQTVLPVKNVSHLFRYSFIFYLFIFIYLYYIFLLINPLPNSSLPIHKIKGLGAKFGEEVCDKLKIKLMSELSAFTLADLQKYFDDKTG